MKTYKWIVATMIGTQLVAAAAMADETADAIASLKKQIEALSRKVDELEKQQSAAGQPTAQTGPLEATNGVEVPKGPALVSAGADGFWMQSADTNFTLHLGAVGQFDWHYYASPNPGAKDTMTIRRLRLLTYGTLFKDYDYYIQTDFGAGNSVTATNNSLLQDAYLNIHYWPWLQLQAGKMKEPVGLEIQPADAALWYVERGYPTELVPNRNVGVEVHGNLFDNALTYYVGAFNGVADGGSGDIETGDNCKDVAARIFAAPFTNSSVAALQNFGFGAGASYGFEAGSTLPSFATIGRQTFFSYNTGAGTASTNANVTEAGQHFRFVPQGYYFWGPAGFFAEYADSSEKFQLNNGKVRQDWFDNKGSDLSASWYLTGEKDNFWAPPVPLHPFRIDGSGLGAWQLTARIGELALDPSSFSKGYAKAGSAHEATTWGVGLDWYWNRNIKWMLEYEQTSFGFEPGDGPAKGLSVQSQDETVLMGRLQFAF
ncbi:MAG: porin [Verrucomicrobiota bacterium]|jgi:phosphate-selective porin OprO/OprP